MPFIIAGLGDIGAAVFCLLLAIAIGYLVKVIVNLLPDIDILGWHIHQFVLDSGDTANRYLLNASKSLWSDFHHMITDLAYIDNRIAQAILNTLDHHASQLSNVARVQVPNAQLHAEQYAQTATDNESARAKSAESSLSSDIHTVALDETALNNYIDGPFHAALESDLHSAAKAAEVNADQYTDHTATALTIQLQNALVPIFGAIQGLDVAVASTIPNEIAALGEQEAASLASAQASDAANLSKAVASITAEIDQIQSEIAAQNKVIATAEATISSLSGEESQNEAAITAANAAITAANGTISNLSSSLSSLQGTLTATQGQVSTLQDTTTIEQSQITSLQGTVGVTIPLTIAAVATAVAAITTEFAECAITSCDGPNNYQNLLNSLLGGASLVELLAFLAEVAKDPSGEAKAVASVASGIYTEGHALIDSLLSL